MTFLNPFMLFGLAAASLPLLIHLLSIRKMRTIEFSSLRFLRELQKTSIRRVRLRQWLLLLLRTLIIVCLVMAFARPALRATLGGFAGRKASSSMAIVVDDSPSMGVRDKLGIRFTQACDAAKKLAALVQDGDAAYVLRSSDLLHVEHPVPLRTATAAVDAIGSLSLSQERVPADETIRRAMAILDESNNANRELYLITDTQASQFAPGTDTSTVSSETIRSFLVRSGDGTVQNAGVQSSEVRTRIASLRRPIEVQAVVRNCSEFDAKDLGVSFYVEGTRVAQQTVSIPAGSVATVNGRFLPKHAGVLYGYVAIDDDAMEADNHSYFAAIVPDRVRVLLAGATADDTRYVALGLTLAGDSTMAGVFDVQRITEAAIPSMDFGDVDVFVGCNLHGFSTSTGERIARFVQEGGGLLLFPGPQTDLSSYDDGLLARLGIPPMRHVSASSSSDAGGTTLFTVTKTDFEHPIFAGMFEQQLGRKATSIVSPAIHDAISPSPGGKGHSLLTMNDGSSFLAEYTAGQGRVLAFAVDAGAAWSDLPLQGVFAPLLYQTILYLSPHSATGLPATAGRPIESTVRLRSTTAPAGFFWTSPSGIDEKVIPSYSGTGGTALFRSSHARETGVYLLRRSAGGTGSTAAPLAAVPVNVDTAETDLRQARTDEVEIFRSRMKISKETWHVLSAADQLTTAVEQSRFGVELWRHFLVAALLLACAEMIVGRSLKRSSEKKGTIAS